MTSPVLRSLVGESSELLQASRASRSQRVPILVPWLMKTVSWLPRQRSQEAPGPQSLALLSDRHSQHHFTAGAKDQKFYGRLGNYSSPTHLPFHLHTHCPRIANSSWLLSCFSKDFTAGKQRLEVFQKLGHSCLQEPFESFCVQNLLLLLKRQPLVLLSSESCSVAHSLRASTYLGSKRMSKHPYKSHS